MSEKARTFGFIGGWIVFTIGLILKLKFNMGNLWFVFLMGLSVIVVIWRYFDFYMNKEEVAEYASEKPI